MRYKYCIAVLLLMAAIGVVFITAPAAAANGSDSVSVNASGGYMVTFYKAPAKTTSGMMTALTTYSITQGQYAYHTRVINYYTTSANWYLYWGNITNSLRLKIYTPDGYVLGPFYDTYDGATDGAIGVTVSKGDGLAQGTWTAEVYGNSVSGTQSYTISYP